MFGMCVEPDTCWIDKEVTSAMTEVLAGCSSETVEWETSSAEPLAAFQSINAIMTTPPLR